MKLDDRGWDNVEALIKMQMSGEYMDSAKRQHLAYAEFDDAERYGAIVESIHDARRKEKSENRAGDEDV